MWVLIVYGFMAALLVAVGIGAYRASAGGGLNGAIDKGTAEGIAKALRDHGFSADKDEILRQIRERRKV